ncbi:IRC6 [[Candida] subhashii]|uniref:Increased recombination centers protein 6 n=1 Tax=[Candida] subhashii TaxID=561895 RepID=A0A8J5UQ59_9ASCO|nr:IRC6 [[Candida] subhashii]KAG7664516.1 IRC6 [[Candida] subhashii]
MIPNHILVLGSPNSGKVRIAQLISQDQDFDYHDVSEDNSHSGIIVKTSLSTKYYSIDLNILIDEYPESRDDLSEHFTDETKLADLHEWYDEFISEDYQELRDALDGIIFTVNLEQDSPELITKAMEIISDIRNAMAGHDDDDNSDGWLGFVAVVGTPLIQSNQEVSKEILDEIEDVVISNGFEFINFAEEGMNEYREKRGKDRIIELLETHEWSNMELKKNDHYKENKLNKIEEMKVGLLEKEGPSDDDDEIDKIFEKLTIAKHHIHSLPQDQKEKYANDVVEEIIDFI